MHKDKILIIGGYGTVGKLISQQLASDFPNQLIIAGRNLDKARKCSQIIGRGSKALQLDVSTGDFTHVPNEVKLVVMCLDLDDMQWVNYCIENGIHYMDITANYKIMKQIESLHDKALKKSVSLLLSVGLAPGFTNILVEELIKNAHEKVTKYVNIFVLLGLGEKHGEEAYRWTFDHIHHNYSISDNTSVKAFTDGKKTEMVGNRKFYLFDFADQHILQKKYQSLSFKTRMAFDITWLTQAVALMRKLGLTFIYKKKWLQRTLIALFKKRKIGSDVFGIKAVLHFEDGTNISSHITGRQQARITATVATIAAKEMMQADIPLGLSHLSDFRKDTTWLVSELQKNKSDWQFYLHPSISKT